LSGRPRCCQDNAKALVIGSAHLAIARWRVTRLGAELHSDYARRFWLPTIGPTCFLLAQTLGDTLRCTPERDHVTVPTIQLAESIGIGGSTGPHAPLARSVARLALFELAIPVDGMLLVRSEWPVLTQRQLRRLPDWLAHQHTNDLVDPRRVDAKDDALIQERRHA
jgi:hypothetical protein